MKRSTLIAFVAGCLVSLTQLAAESRFVFHHENVLGTSFELRVAGATAEQAVNCETAALTEVDRLTAMLSSYNDDSEVSRWQRTRGQAVAVSPELDAVLALFDQWRVRTAGALNPAVAAVGNLWREAEGRQQLPAEAAIQRATAAINRPHWQREPGSQRATHLSDTPLVFNSLTKSFIIQRAAEAAMTAARPGGLMLNIGGDLIVAGAFEERIAIADPAADAENAPPLDTLLLTGRAMATSGSYRRGYEINGHHYSHILDPRTGWPADDVLSATVITPNAVDAGALATAMCVLTTDTSARLATTVPGAEYLIVLRDGRRFQSPGWSTLHRPLVQLAAAGAVTGLLAADSPRKADAPTGPRWDETMELVINFEMAPAQGGRYRRPYVAVWIEDQDKFPVHTLALWYQKPRWLPDLKAWYRGDQMRLLVDETNLSNTISSATRSPGKYTLKWDGKDDKGVPVKPGKYTILIEMAREHGTYQLARKEMDFNGAPAQASLPGNAEMTGASLDYRRKQGR